MNEPSPSSSADLRFSFGKNWRSFLDGLTPTRVEHAKEGLAAMLGASSLDGKTFLDVGSGSGLSSLAARMLGASVRSFDFDPDSVGCTTSLRERFYPGDERWVIERGDALDEAYLESLGTFDVVYSWGVLHHTGSMWRAIDLVSRRVKPGGLFEVALYNDQGERSARWRRVKQRYNALPTPLRPAYAALVMLPSELKALAAKTLRGRPHEYVHTWTRYESKRGMSRAHDLVDWVGGYPFEVASPEAVVHFMLERGFSLRKLKTVGGGLGCNDFVFVRGDARATQG